MTMVSCLSNIIKCFLLGPGGDTAWNGKVDFLAVHLEFRDICDLNENTRLRRNVSNTHCEHILSTTKHVVDRWWVYMVTYTNTVSTCGGWMVGLHGYIHKHCVNMWWIDGGFTWLHTQYTVSTCDGWMVGLHGYIHNTLCQHVMDRWWVYMVTYTTH